MGISLYLLNEVNQNMIAILVRFLTTLLLVGSLSFFVSCGSKVKPETPAASSPRAAMMSVRGVVTKVEPFENVVLSSGTVLASESVDLTAEAPGTVETIFFREGAHVKKGDMLVKIKHDDLLAQLKKTEVQIQLAKDQADRQKRLFETNNTSKEQYDISMSMLAGLQADRDNLLAAIHKREMRSPFDGIIGLRYVSEGSYVSSTTRIASVQKINPLKVDFSIPEKYAGKVNVGDQVKLSSDEANLQFTGTVYAVEPEIEPTTRTVQLRALCENKGESIFPGGYVHVELHLKQLGGAMMIPTQAIIPVLKGQTVFVCRNGVVAVAPVKTGTRTPSSVQIVEGLAAGDTVITTGILQLRPGMPVNVRIKE